MNIYKALLQKGKSIIVFSIETVDSSFNVTQVLSFNVYRVTSNYQKQERFLYTSNSTWEICCFVITSVVPVNIDALTFEQFKQ